MSAEPSKIDNAMKRLRELRLRACKTPESLAAQQLAFDIMDVANGAWQQLQIEVEKVPDTGAVKGFKLMSKGHHAEIPSQRTSAGTAQAIAVALEGWADEMYAMADAIRERFSEQAAE
jgi:hypothetical protein